MGTPSPQNAANWHDIATARARDVGPRLVFSAMIAIAGGFLGHGAWPGVWLVATAAAQLATLLITEPMRRDAGFAVSPWRQRLFYVAVAVSGLIFAACGPLLWFAGGDGGQLFAVIVLSGGIVNVAMQAGDSARLLWIVAGPQVLFLQGLPLVSLVSAVGPERRVLIFTSVAATLIVLHLIVASQRSVRNVRQVKLALQATERERARAEAASAAKSDFLAVMSHELRTPLNGVLGMAQAMGADRLSGAQRDRLKVLQGSGETLLLLLNDLIDISMIDTAKLEIASQVVEVAALVERAEAVFGPMAAAKGLKFGVQVLGSAGEARRGDPRRVRQVLHNLISNAIKFTERGSVSVLIRGGPDELVLDVSDTGPGVPAERTQALFERFNQADPGVTRRYGGSGLGLAIARGLAELMGGDISVASTVGVGSIFTARLRLPLAEAPAAPARLEPPPTLQPVEPARLCVLAAEDNPTNQLVLKTLLEQIGATVHLAADGAAAVAAWRTGAWDLILMDIQMPRMDGLSAARAIRAAEAADGRGRTPIIAVTANATPEQAAEYLAAGMDGLTPKPIQFAQLMAVIADVLGAAEDQAAARSAA